LKDNNEMKRHALGLSALALLALGLTASSANAQTITNGSFETDPYIVTSLASGGPLTGWTITTTGSNGYPYGMNNSSGYGPTPYGSQFLLLGYYGDQSHNYIEQTITGLTPGGLYFINFAIATEGYSNLYGAGNHSQLTASFSSGSSTAAETFTAPSSTANFWDTWQLENYNFTADGTSATLRLAQADPILQGFDLGVDNVSIIRNHGDPFGTPEPGTLAMLIAGGVSGCGLLLRRRSARK